MDDEKWAKFTSKVDAIKGRRTVTADDIDELAEYWEEAANE